MTQTNSSVATDIAIGLVYAGAIFLAAEIVDAMVHASAMFGGFALVLIGTMIAVGRRGV